MFVTRSRLKLSADEFVSGDDGLDRLDVVKSLGASTETKNWDYFYFRTKNGAEIDLILEGPFGTLPIEIKFGSTIKQSQMQTLKNFVYKNNLPLGIVINNSDDVQLVADRILQMPATLI